MLKKIFATFMVLSSLALTGCTMANLPKVEKYPDLTKTEELIVKGQSDIRDVRELFGAPTVKGRTLNEDHLVIGYAIMNEQDYGDSFGTRLLDALTLKNNDCWGHTYTQKNVYFKFDNNDKVEEIQYRGYVWIRAGGSWNSSYFQALTEEEFKRAEPLNVDQIIQSFSSKNISDESIEKFELTYNSNELTMLYYLCCKGANKVFENQVKFIDEKVPAESYDGTKSSLLFDKVEFNYK